MRMLLLAGCAAFAMLGWSPDNAEAGDRHRHGHGHISVGVTYGGGYYGGPVICDPPRPVYREYCPPPVQYCPPPVQYCPPPVVYRPCPPVYYGRPVYTGHYHGGYRGGYGHRGHYHCD